MSTLNQSQTTTYVVRYYDASFSRKGQGVQAKRFTDKGEAEGFAAGHQLYARPAKVEEVGNTSVTKYFSGDVELKGSYPMDRAAVRALFPTGKIQNNGGTMSLLVGTVDGKYSLTNFLPVTRIVHFNALGSGHKCDARCLNAKRGDCECSCGGKNHGAGR